MRFEYAHALYGSTRMCIIVARDEEARARNMHGGKVGGAGNGDYGRERSRAGEKMELFQVTPR